MTTVWAALALSVFTSLSHIRTTEPALRAALDAGVAQSEMFRALVDRLNESDVVVYLVRDDNPPPGIAGHVTFAAAAGGVRYVRISIVPRLSGSNLVAILGHELWHAVEIAGAPSVVDQPTMAAFYLRVGERKEGEPRTTFDTAAAVAAGDRIRREALRRGRVDAPDPRP